jgi:hypothetical protein
VDGADIETTLSLAGAGTVARSGSFTKAAGVDATKVEKAFSLGVSSSVSSGSLSETTSVDGTDIERARARALCGATEAELSNDTTEESTSSLKTAGSSSLKTKAADQALDATLCATGGRSIGTSVEEGAD